MSTLRESHRLRDQIRLENKMKVFRNNLRQSRQMMTHKSVNVMLADKIFYQCNPSSKRRHRTVQNSSYKKNSPFKNKQLKNNTKKLRASTSSSKSLSSSKIVAKSLQNKTSYLQDLVSKSSSLLMEKKELQQKISFLKQKISIQSRKLKIAHEKSGKYHNQIQEFNKKTQRVINNYMQAKHHSQKERLESLEIQRQIETTLNRKNLIQLNIKSVKQDNKRFKGQVKYLHRQIRSDALEANQMLHSLRDSQKKLKSEIVMKQQLANNKAAILLQANSIIMNHKK